MPTTTPTPATTPATTTSAPIRRRGTARRQDFGAVRRLPSGRWQARFTDADGARRPAPRTFATRREAEDWITTRRADHLRGEWRSPEVGATALDQYARDYLATRVDLAPRTLDGYRRLLDPWIDHPATHPSGRTINLGSTHLRDLSPMLVCDWYAAALCEAQQRAVAYRRLSGRSTGE